MVNVPINASRTLTGPGSAGDESSSYASNVPDELNNDTIVSTVFGLLSTSALRCLPAVAVKEKKSTSPLAESAPDNVAVGAEPNVLAGAGSENAPDGIA